MITGIEVYFNKASNRFEFVGTSTGGTVLSEWYIAITGPDGSIKTIDMDSADDTGVALAVNVNNTDASMLDGAYTIKVIFFTNRTGAPEDYDDQSVDFTLDSSETMSLNLTHNGSTITGKDVTVYPPTSPVLSHSTFFTRSMSIVYPIVGGVPNSPAYTFSGTQGTIPMGLSDGLIYENVTWGLAGSVDGEFVTTVALDNDSDGDWVIIYPRVYTGNTGLLVLIGTDPCSILSCLDTKWLELYNQACKAGGVSKLPTYLADELQLLLGNMTMYQYWNQCGNITKAQEYYERLKSMTSATCSLPSGPVAVGGVVTGSSWTTIPADQYLTGFARYESDPLQWMIQNNTMYFRGRIDPSALIESGANMIDPDYWTGLGVAFENGVGFDCVDVDSSNVDELCYGKVQNATLRIFKFSGAAVVHDFIIIGGLPLV